MCQENALAHLSESPMCIMEGLMLQVETIALGYRGYKAYVIYQVKKEIPSGGIE